MPWITPDVPPGDLTCYKIYVPYGVDYEAALYGAFLSLTEAENWEVVSGQPAQTVADAFLDAWFRTVTFARCGMIGSIFWWASETLPDNVLECDGDVLDVAEWPELYAVIGNTFGGEPGVLFSLPDIGTRFISGRGGGDIGEKGGSATHTLIEAELPAHAHTMSFNLVGVPTGSGAAPIIPQAAPSVLTGETGGDQPHNNLPPYFTLVPVIVAR